MIAARALGTRIDATTNVAVWVPAMATIGHLFLVVAP
jgi:hypothetical protein